jgi:hypothetical protein
MVFGGKLPAPTIMTLMPVLGFASGVAETAILGSLDSSILARSGIQGTSIGLGVSSMHR